VSLTLPACLCADSANFCAAEAFQRKRFRDREMDRVVFTRAICEHRAVVTGQKLRSHLLRLCFHRGFNLSRIVIASFYCQFTLLSVDDNVMHRCLAVDTIVSLITFYSSRVDREIITLNHLALMFVDRHLCLRFIRRTVTLTRQ